MDPVTSRRPLVSVVIPCFRQAAYLAETVSSVALQTFADWEVVIVDDGSPDDTAQVARRLAASLPDRTIRLLEQANAGVSVARNNGIRAARGDYILPLDADDLLDPTFLEKTVAALEAHPEAAIAHTDYMAFGGRNGVIKTGPFELALVRESNVLAYASLYRRSVWEAAGGYDPGMVLGYEDWDFWITCAERGFSAVHVPETLLFYRVKSESRDSRARQHDRELKAQIVLNHPAVYPEESRRQAAELLGTQRLPDGRASEPDAARPLPEPADATERRGRQVEETGAAPPARARWGGDRPLRILHTVGRYAPSVDGPGTVVRQVSERLVRRGHSVTVATALDHWRAFRELNGVPVLPFAVTGCAGREIGLNGEDLLEYARFLERPDWDVAMHYGSQDWPTDLALLSLDVTRRLRANVLAPGGYPALGESLDTCTLRFLEYYRDLLPKALPKLDAVLYHSANSRDHGFGRRLGLRNGVVIPNGASEEEFDRAPRCTFRDLNGIRTPHLAICVANFHPVKRQDRALAALHAARRDDLTVVFIGRDLGSLRTCRRLATGLPNVLFLEHATREETVAAFHDADLFLLTSQYESAPLVIVEAMASRTPFVSTDVGNVRELPGGIVCAPEDMAAHLTRLLHDPAERRRLAEEGHLAWRERFTWERIADAYEDLYLRLGAARRGPRCISLPDASSGASEESASKARTEALAG